MVMRNEVDDIIILNIGVDGRSITVGPSSWTEIRNNFYSFDVAHGVYWIKATTANMTMPSITISGIDECVATAFAVAACDLSTPVGNTASNTGTSSAPTWSSISYSAYSSVFYLGVMNLRSMLTVGSKFIIDDRDPGTVSNIVAREFFSSGGTTGSVAGTAEASSEWQTFTLELSDNGNSNLPVYFTSAPISDNPQTTLDTSDGWRNAVADSQVIPSDGSSVPAIQSYDASSDVNTSTDEITITGHPYTSGDIVRADANGNTLPTGITDDLYYYIHVVDANTVKLEAANTVVVGTASSYWYDSASPSVVDITATGSGTCRFEYAGVLTFGFQSSTINFVTHGTGHDSGGNYYGAPIKFSSPRDMSAEVLFAFVKMINLAHYGTYIMFIDSDGDYKTFKIGDSLDDILTDVGLRVVDPNASTSASYEYGTFNSAAVEYIVFMWKFNAANSTASINAGWDLDQTKIISEIEVVGGSSADPVNAANIYNELQLYGSISSEKRSDAQWYFAHDLKIGDASVVTVTDETGKAIDFPATTNLVDDYAVQISDRTLSIDPTATDTLSMANMLIASDNGLTFSVDAARPAGASIDFTNCIFSKCTPTLRDEDTFTTCTFVGGGRVVHNDADFTGCTFENITDGNGYLLLSTTHDLDDCDFKTDTASDYAIEIDTAGSYTLADMTYTGFTKDINVTETTGTVTITVDGGDTPTYDTAGATVVITTPPVTADISITGMPTAGANIRLQIINNTGASASAWQATTAYSAGDKVLRTTGVGTENTAGLYFVATTAGTSGGSEPTWDTTPGNTTSDGTVTWTTYKVLYYDQDPAGASIADTYTEGEEFIAGDSVTVRFAEMDGATSFKTYESDIITTSAGFTVSVDETTDSVYGSNALDGSGAAITAKFTADYTNDEIDLDANQDFAGTEAYAYYCYELTSSQGMYSWWGGVTAIDTGSYRINASVLSMYFDETAGFVKQTDNARWYRDDGSRPALDPTTGGNGLEINWRNPVYLETTGSALTAAQNTQLFAVASQTSVDTVDANVDAIKAKTDQLNFTGNDVQSVASNMRGTDSAATASALSTVSTNVDTINTNLTTVDGIVDTINTNVDEIHKLQGLDAANPMTVTTTSRTAGTISQTISGDGIATSTVTRT
jgi:hypothetical protein